MAKEIKAHLTSDNHLVLEEVGEVGDYIDLNFIPGIDTNKLKEVIEDAVQERLKNEAGAAVLAFKQSPEFKELFEDHLKISKFEEIKEKAIAIAVANSEKNFRSEIDSLDAQWKEKLENSTKENNRLAQELSIEKQRRSDQKDSFQREKKAAVEIALEREKVAHRDEILRIKAKHDEDNNKLRDEINSLKSENNDLKRSHDKSIKLLGNELEDWCFNEYERNLGGVIMDAKFKRASSEDNLEPGDRHKPDFLLEVKLNNLSSRAIFEMKTKETDSVNSRSNESHLKKLEKDRKNFGADYGILVSELESGNISWTISPDYPNIFIVQPAFFVPITRLIYAILKKQLEIKDAQQNYEFKGVEEIMTEFESMKNDILSKSFSFMKNNLQTVRENVEKIRQISDDLITNQIATIEGQIRTVTNKIESFRIQKIVKKIDGISK